MMDVPPNRDEESRHHFLLIHALPLCVVWLLLVPLALLAAFERRRRWRLRRDMWFPIHVVILTVVYVVTLFSTSIAWENSTGKHLVHWHRKLGVSTVVFLSLQMLLGIYIAVARASGRVFLQVHHWLGRAVLLNAYLAILIGCLWRRNDIHFILVSIALGVGSFVLAYYATRIVRNRRDYVSMVDTI